MMFRRFLFLLSVLLSLTCGAAHAAGQHALTFYGEPPKYGVGFTHFDYVNPDAPKGGEMSITTEDPLRFDHLIPYSVDGWGVKQIDTLVYAPLAYRSLDETMTVYGYIAQSMELAPDRSWIRFRLNPKARFDDGTQITAEDVAYSYDLFHTQARFDYRVALAGVTRVVVESPTQVRFDMAADASRFLPLKLAELRVLPKHWWETRDFNRGGGYEPPLGSGPYRVAKVDPGQTVVFERVKNWWGEGLPVARGMYNFDRITVKVYGSRDAMRQAVLAEDVDINVEKVGAAYRTGYQIPALADGRLKKGAFGEAAGFASGFVFNARRPMLADARVRQAIAMLWDFEWVNARLSGGASRRQVSMFAPADLQANGLPVGKELEILASLRAQVPPQVFDTPFTVPRGDGSGNIRDRQIAALKLLESAGWHPSGDHLVNAAGEPLSLTFLNVNKGFERVFMSFKRSLAQIGVTLNIRTVDISQYGNLLQKKQFDVIYYSFLSPAIPGQELTDYYASASYDRPGSQNWMGVHSPAVDALIAGARSADTRASMQAYMHALDRVLQWQYLWIPGSYSSEGTTLVYWNRFGQPRVQARANENLDAWWRASDVPQRATSRQEAQQ